MRSPMSSLEAEHGMDEKCLGDAVAMHRSRTLDMSGLTLVGSLSLRFSDYGRGLVSIREDFASATQKPDSSICVSMKRNQCSST